MSSILDREKSSVEAVDECLARIAACNDLIHAMMTVTEDEARASASACDEAAAKGDSRGLLHGMPIVLKDNIDTAGIRTTSGSRFFADRKPAHDAPVVQRLKSAGAVLIGKASMAEFAMGAGTPQNPHYPECRNPWDLDRIPGGSSSGSAAAVASEMAVGALGTDTGGSVRLPGSYCGVVAMRPTSGRVPNRGTTPVSPHFDTVGPLAYRAADVARILAAIEGYDAEDLTSVRGPMDDILGQLSLGVQGLRIGVPSNAFFDELHPEVESAVQAAIEVLVSLGATKRDVVIDEAEKMPRMTQLIRNPDAVVVHERRLADAPELFGQYVFDRLQSGLAMSAVDYARARVWQAGWIRQMEGHFDTVDLIVTPMVAQPPPRSDDPDLNVRMASLTGPANAWVLANLPAVSVPCGMAEGLPVGLQLVGPAWSDGLVLRAAHAYQQATDWHHRRPGFLTDLS